MTRRTPPRRNALTRAFTLGRHTVMTLGFFVATLAAAQTDGGSAQGGPIRLRAPQPSADATPQGMTPQGLYSTVPMPSRRTPPAEMAPPDDFELYVSRQASADPLRPIRRLGTDLVSALGADDGEDTQPLVPPDYIISPGDELQLLLWGSVDAEMRLTVDRSGRIAIPRIGSIMVAGTRYADLQELIGKRAGQVFKNFQLSVTLGRLRNVRVYLSGYVQRPGSYSVSALSTVVAALMRAGGPSAAGSYRNVQLRRGGQSITQIDLYDLLLRGEKSADRVVQSDDIIYVGPVGPRLGLIGSINRPAVIEFKPGETLNDAVTMGGGFNAIADRSRLTLERVDDRMLDRVRQLEWPVDGATVPKDGDLLRAFSAIDAVLPLSRQNKRIRVEGEVQRPGEYVVPADVSLRTVVALAGGPTPNAYLYGTEFIRESVRLTQQTNYDRAIRDLETEFARASGTQRAIDAQDALAQQTQSAANAKLIDRLKAVKPTGRVVLQLNLTATELPDLPLEESDRVYIPPRPSAVGVFGSVFSNGSYLLDAGKSIGDFVTLAGGPTRGADTSNTFVVRANGSVVSQPQRSGFLGLAGNGLNQEGAQAGDTIFVPEEINKTTWIQNIKEWTVILYQFGLGAAAFKTLRN